MTPRRTFMLALGLPAFGLAAWLWPKPSPPVTPQSRGLRRLWIFSAPRPGAAIAAPWIDEHAIHFATAHIRGFQLEGAVYSLDPATGRPIWTFDANETMLPTASAPLAANGRIYIGEGMHSHFSCRMFCLDAAGKQQWSFPTTDHIEGGAALHEGTLIFPAGNDGLYGIDAATGARRWNFREGLHIDSTPFVSGDRVYVGSGPSRKFATSQIVCLAASTGEPSWRTRTPLPAWATPIVSGDRVFAGLGNGRLTEAAQPPETPAGALACLDARSGDRKWTAAVGDAVFGQPLVVGDRVVFGSRDGHLYGTDFDGNIVFRLAVGGPVISSPVVHGGQVYAASVPGRIVCVDPADGSERWRFELRDRDSDIHLYAPLRIHANRLYVAEENRTPGSAVGIVSLSCFELEV